MSAFDHEGAHDFGVNDDRAAYRSTSMPPRAVGGPEQFVDKDWLDLDNRFKHHPPVGAQPHLYAHVRAQAKNFVDYIIRNTPQSRERDFAVKAIEEAVMWANAGIARRTSPAMHATKEVKGVPPYISEYVGDIGVTP